MAYSVQSITSLRATYNYFPLFEMESSIVEFLHIQFVCLCVKALERVSGEWVSEMPHFWNSRPQKKSDWWIEFYWITCTRTHTSLSGILDVIISAVYSLLLFFFYFLFMFFFFFFSAIVAVRFSLCVCLPKLMLLKWQEFRIDGPRRQDINLILWRYLHSVSRSSVY